jgi:signal transduction histidine kinase
MLRGNRSLLAYFAVRVLAPLSVLMLGLMILGFLIFQQLVASLVFDRDSELGDLTALDLRLELREYSAALRSVTDDSNLLSASPETRLVALKEAAARRQQLYAGMALLDSDNTIIALTSEDVQQCALAASEGDLFAAQGLYDVLISNVLIDPRTRESMIAIGAPLAGEGGGAQKVLLGCVRLRNAEMVDLLASLTVGGSGFAYLVDRNGRAIYHPDEFALGEDFSDRSYVQKVLEGEQGGTLWDSPNGDRWIVDYTPISEAGWGLIIKEPRDIAIAPAHFYGTALVVLGVIVVLVVFILLWFGVQQMALPIRSLVVQTTLLAEEKEVTSIQSSGITEIDTLSHSFDHMAGQIASYRSSLRRYIGLITQSQEDERRRIARELHDETIQNLLAMARRVELQQATEKDPARQMQLASLSTMIGETLDGVRHISHDLRPPMLEDLGLIPSLRTLIERLAENEQHAPLVTFNVSEHTSPLSPNQELVLYRISQEALTNIQRHAHASEVQVNLSFEPDVVCLDIRDNGIGFLVPNSVTELVQRGHFGLMGIQERVWSVGGTLAIHSTPGAGTRLTVTIPVDDPEA